MTDMMPVQKFQIGDRVRSREGCSSFPEWKPTSFLITGVRAGDKFVEYTGHGTLWYEAHQLILAPERPPYVASERLVLGRDRGKGVMPDLYRCETDAEMVARHVIERAAYDQAGAEV